MPSSPLKVFLSYSREDESWKERLVTHLHVLEKEGYVKVWTEYMIPPGSVRQRKILQAIDDADAAILLISAKFLASSKTEDEIPRLLARSVRKIMALFPVIVETCLWRQVSWLQKLEALPRGGKPLSARQGSQLDEALLEIASEILKLVEVRTEADSLIHIESDELRDFVLERIERAHRQLLSDDENEIAAACQLLALYSQPACSHPWSLEAIPRLKELASAQKSSEKTILHVESALRALKGLKM